MASLVLQGRVEGSVIYGDVQEDIQRRHGTPLQYSCLENPVDGGPWGAIVHRVSKSQTRLK